MSAAMSGTVRRMPKPQTPADDLDRLAHAVSRLSPSHRDPHRFHEDKSEIAAELRRLARALGSPTPVRVR